MTTNISKYVQLTDFLLLEYEFSRDGVAVTLNGGAGGTPTVANTQLGSIQYFSSGGQGETNNTLILNSTPVDANRGTWYANGDDQSGYFDFFDSSTAYATPTEYAHDTLKVHIVSGYNFDDIAGFLLQVQAEDASLNKIDLSNFTWINQVQGDDVLKFATNSLYLGNRFYDKYLEFKVPSVQELGGDVTAGFPAALGIKQLSDVFLTYSTIETIDENQYVIQEQTEVQLPVTSEADNFNCFIAESTSGDYIEYYATWKDLIIGNYMNDIETGRIKLYTSNNPNDNYEAFTNQYGVNTNRWVIIHEIFVYEHIPGGSSLLTSKFSFTQDDQFNDSNFFRPVIKNSDIIASYSIDYVCRLTNRMDGSQIIRKASFTSENPKKYGNELVKLNVDNLIPYKVFNRIEAEKPAIVNDTVNRPVETQFVKVFFDTTNVLLDSENTVFPQGTGPLFLRRSTSFYDFKFSRLNVNTDTPRRENVDLSGAFDYALVFKLDDDSRIEISPTYSTNMNTVLGQLEFKVTEEQSERLLNQSKNAYSIIIKNPDGTSYVYYEGVFFPYQNFTQVISQYSALFDVTELQNQITSLTAENRALVIENETLKTT